MRAAATLALALLPVVAGAGETDVGRELALRWCTACHIVAPNEPGGDAGPAFDTLTGERTEAALRAWLFEPHPPMPDLKLTAREIDALVAYIGSLVD